MDPNPWDDALGQGLMTTVVALVIVGVGWWNSGRGRKVLHKWGVPAPGDEQTRAVMGYLRRRWIWYPWFVGASAVLGVALAEHGFRPGAYAFLGFMVGGVLGDVVCALGARRDSQKRHGLFELVPPWAVLLYGGLVVMTIAFAVVDLMAGPHLPAAVANVMSPPPAELMAGPPAWSPFAATAVGALVVGTGLVLCMRRSIAADDAVDTALRRRSARVVLGMAFPLQLLIAAMSVWRTKTVGDHEEHAMVPSWPGTFADVVQPVLFAGFLVVLFAWIRVAGPAAGRR
ncbi:hypothetical protein [Saccharopolyspora taberi]|uniref:Uncharacterized protein n=1 Tax=Saccharopolyspora taberi TaxID=60895 RepID=A0ABN3VDI3_9PSEU